MKDERYEEAPSALDLSQASEKMPAGRNPVRLAVSDDEFLKFLRRSAKEMRSRPTDVERALWWRLRDRKLGGLKFRRQRPEGAYIADFVCLEARLIVELDGAQHEGCIADRHRTQDLMRIGFDVVRFSNEEVRRDIDAVCERIVRVAKMRT